MFYGYTQVTEEPHTPFFPNGSLPAFEQDLATFLLARGPYAWLGSGWLDCHDDSYYQQNELRPPALELDYGTPIDDHCIDLDAAASNAVGTEASGSSSGSGGGGSSGSACVGYAVSGAGDAAANGCYALATIAGQAAYALNADYQLYAQSNVWRIGHFGHVSGLAYVATVASALPPQSAGDWGLSTTGMSPTPTVRRSGMGPPPLPGNVGRFRREWTKATVEMDCSIGKYGKATITMKTEST